MSTVIGFIYIHGLIIHTLRPEGYAHRLHFVDFCFGLEATYFTHIFRGYFTADREVIRLIYMHIYDINWLYDKIISMQTQPCAYFMYSVILTTKVLFVASVDLRKLTYVCNITITSNLFMKQHFVPLFWIPVLKSNQFSYNGNSREGLELENNHCIH